jgi:Family of unknown function (DUF6194)
VDETEVIARIVGGFDGVHRVVSADGASFFSSDPEVKLPFATLVNSNAHDQFSDLDRPGAFRLNIGVGKATWVGLFGQPLKGQPGDYGLGSGSAADWDFTAPDVVMPHPVYGRMHWICVVNPSDAIFETLMPFLGEAYAIDRARTTARDERRAAR